MLKVYNCIATAHDLWLVGLAAVVCALASYAAINLLHHARSSKAHMRGVWLAVSAVTTGFGIWATHFIAMLAFSPGIPSGYNIKLTFLSLVAAILLTGVGLGAAMRPNSRLGPWLGGAIVGGGIAARRRNSSLGPRSRGRINRAWSRDRRSCASGGPARPV
jgi:NO-binding membrane sensor protein with MHYT domain